MAAYTAIDVVLMLRQQSTSAAPPMLPLEQPEAPKISRTLKRQTMDTIGESNLPRHRPLPARRGGRRMKPVLLALLFILLGPGYATASTPVQGDSGMVPSLGEAMPLEARNGRIILARPIALAPGRILAAGTLFRHAFRTPTPKEIQRANQSRNSSELEKTYSGRRTGISALKGNTQTEMERALAFKAAEPAWSDPRQLAAFFHTLPLDDYFVAIQSSPEAKPEVLQLKFPDDILLIQTSDGVQVGAVLTDSAAGRSGLKAGMLIDTIGGIPVEGSLETYLKALPRARRSGQESGGHLLLTVRDQPGSDPRTIAIRLPRSLSNPDDLFSDILSNLQP